MSTYTAWDGNEYPMPAPEGWYLATDDRWWPEGHGPGPAPAAPPPSFAGNEPGMGLPSAAPPMGDTTDWSSAPQDTIYSAPPAGSGTPDAFAAPAPSDGGGGGGGKKIAIVAVGLLGLVGLGGAAFLAVGGSDDDAAAPATTVFQTQQDEVGGSSETTATAGDQGAETTVAAPAAGKGSIDDPYVVGDTIVVQYNDAATGDQRTWNIEVLAPASDITQAVLDENQFNDPPEGDAAFIGVPIRVTYVSGPAPASLFELTFKAVGPSGVVLTTFDPSCGVIPDALDTFAEVFEGGAVEGNICWPASPTDAGDLTMLLEVFLDDTVVYTDLGG